MIPPEIISAHEKTDPGEDQASVLPALNLLELSKTSGEPTLNPPAPVFADTAAGSVKPVDSLSLSMPAAVAENPAADLEKLYPELAFSRMAIEALEDKSGDPKGTFEKANTLFHLAEIQVEKFIDYQGGIAAIFQTVTRYNDELFKILGQFSRGERGLKIPESSEKAGQEKLLRELLKDFSREDLLSALRGEKGEALKQALVKVYDSDEKEVIDEIDLSLNKVQLLSSLKVRHALAANAYAVRAQDSNARILSENILKSIAAIDPETFKASPEIRGLILQSERGEAMDLQEGKAVALAFNEEARKTIIRTLTGADALINGDLRVAGGAEAIKLLAASIAANAETAKKAWDEWPLSKKFPVLFERAKDLVAGQKNKDK